MSTSTKPRSGPPPPTALVHFRVRCATLGHGEDVYLRRCSPSDGGGEGWKLPLHTTAKWYPWYRALRPLTIKLDGERPFRYRYQIYRGGEPCRWEQPSDGLSKRKNSENNRDKMLPKTVDMGHAPDKSQHIGDPISLPRKNEGRWNMVFQNGSVVTMDEDLDEDSDELDRDPFHPPLHHTLQLDLLEPRGEYVVRDVLGDASECSRPERVQLDGNRRRRSSVSTLHSRGTLRRAAPPPLPVAAAARPTGGRTVGFQTPPPSAEPERPPRTPPEPAVKLDSNDGLVVVSAFLPVLLDRDEETGAWSATWDDEVLLGMQTTHLRVTRVGMARWNGDEGVPASDRAEVEARLSDLDCVPVWIDAELFREMYNGFCKGVLWPIMHNMQSVYTSMPRISSEEAGINVAGRDRENHFKENQQCEDDETLRHRTDQVSIYDRGRQKELLTSYKNVNLRFTEVVAQLYNVGDLIWVHGFHLMILPTFIRRRIPMAKIGIFLHTPFPSSEIFRTAWFREELLRGMLNADQVGFHLFEYARHFLTSCRRILGLNFDMAPNAAGGQTLAIDVNGRHVAITNIHAGIEPRILYQTLAHKSTLAQAQTIRDKCPGKTIFCSVDRLESLKGIPLKMLGIKRFLERCPQWVGKIVLIQIGISAHERGDDYKQTKREVMDIVTAINNVWPGTIYFEERTTTEMRLFERMALMRAADVVLITPVRDGLNLVPLEYALVHNDALTAEGRRDGRKRGICILSEFSSCARVMRGALKVNPWMVSEIANAFYQALTMPDDERLRRLSIAAEYVRRVTTERWAHAVLLDLKGVYKNSSTIRAGLGGGCRQIIMESGFDSLNFGPVLSAFKKARSRLILLDYGGTIVSNDNLDNITRFEMVRDKQSHSVPGNETMYAIEELCLDRRNVVFVVSGKERHFLMEVFGHIPNLGLAAEHGMFLAWPTKNTWAKRQWEKLVPIADQQWRSIAMAIMQVYASRTSGSYMEETEMKVLWQYRDADPEFGYMQAKELKDNLSKYLREHSVDVLHSGLKEGGYVEVRPKGVNKGVMSMKIIKNFPLVAQKDQIEFALVLGDDHCDEPMLSVMRQIGHRAVESGWAMNGEGQPPPRLPPTIARVDVSPCDDFVAPGANVFTCTVGKKPSAAEHCLHDVDEVLEMLNALVKVSARDRRRCYSSIELRQFGHTGLVLERQPQRSTSCGEIEITAAGSFSRLTASPAPITLIDGVVPGAARNDAEEGDQRTSWADNLNPNPSPNPNGGEDSDGDVADVGLSL